MSEQHNCIQGAEIKRVDENIKRIDNTVKDHDERLRAFEVMGELNRLSIENNTKVMEKFSDTLDDVSTAMKAIVNTTTENKEHIASVGEKVDSLEKKFDKSESKTKIDLRDIAKRISIDLLVGGGVAIIAWMVASYFQQ